MSASSISPIGACPAPDAQRDGGAGIHLTTRTERRGRAPRQWTAEEQAVIDCYVDRVITYSEARTRLRCGHGSLTNAAAARGRPIAARAADPSRPAAARTTAPRDSGAGPSSPNCAPAVEAGAASSPSGWTVIATRTDRGWRMADDAPVLIEDARRLVEQGRAITTQRRTAEGFELLFRWVSA